MSSCISIDAEAPAPQAVAERALEKASLFAERFCGYRKTKKVHVELTGEGENLKASVECFPEAMEDVPTEKPNL